MLCFYSQSEAMYDQLSRDPVWYNVQDIPPPEPEQYGQLELEVNSSLFETTIIHYVSVH